MKYSLRGWSFGQKFVGAFFLLGMINAWIAVAILEYLRRYAPGNSNPWDHVAILAIFPGMLQCLECDLTTSALATAALLIFPTLLNGFVYAFAGFWLLAPAALLRKLFTSNTRKFFRGTHRLLSL